MELRRFLRLLRRRAWLVVATVVVATGIAYAVTPRQSVYQSQATIYVGQRQFQLSDPSLTGANAAGLALISTTYADMLTSAPVAQAAIQQTGIKRSPQAVAAATRASLVPGTLLIKVAVVDPDPSVAQSLADGITNAFVSKIQQFEPGAPAATGTVPAAAIYVFEPANLPTAPLPTGSAQRYVVGALFGLVASVGVILLLDYLDLSIKSAEEAERRIGLPVLGVIPLHQPSLPAPTRLARSGLRPVDRGSTVETA